ncbi:MAG: hypothetical protein UT24_C0003G0014 [Candidatus Woesebacteria bacterium GW2011_GWB1_39_12]|uniref:Uncharacterized protein n=1 Tax=Candidatus Woesebacteria bacterium GW2011_GWB1_39_12 TaxID=1618574 RepID=A0A0G0QIV6_9BACT|nr:MAG: hypothetical protein UT24_C0003G0014 [Candidatus Woesebacteria bacterium GW2011_GWB1_39_12]
MSKKRKKRLSIYAIRHSGNTVGYVQAQNQKEALDMASVALDNGIYDDDDNGGMTVDFEFSHVAGEQGAIKTRVNKYDETFKGHANIFYEDDIRNLVADNVMQFTTAKRTKLKELPEEEED